MFDIFYLSTDDTLEYLKLKVRFPFLKKVSSLDEAATKSMTKMFWIVPSHIKVRDDFNFDYKVSVYDQQYIHVFKNSNKYNGVVLINKTAKISDREKLYYFFVNKKEIDIAASTDIPYDVVFISYNEPNADINYERLLKLAPYAKRVDKVKGIHNAHKRAATLALSNMFWVIDGDAYVVDNFDFTYTVDNWEHDTVRVWRSKNPINGLEYGYGGAKLLPRALALNITDKCIDVSTSISSNFKVMDEVSNVTMFNTDPFSSWKSAFRECVKLSSSAIDRNITEENKERLNIWCTVDNGEPYGKWVIKGAIAGKQYGESNTGNATALNRINDFRWLHEQFSKHTVE